MASKGSTLLARANPAPFRQEAELLIFSLPVAIAAGANPMRVVAPSDAYQRITAWHNAGGGAFALLAFGSGSLVGALTDLGPEHVELTSAFPVTFTIPPGGALFATGSTAAVRLNVAIWRSASAITP